LYLGYLFMLFRKYRPLFFVISLVFFPVLTHAAPDAGSLLQQQKLQQEQLRAPIDIPDVKDKESVVPKASEQEARVTVKGFKFTGSISVFTEQQLNELLNNEVGQALTLNELKALADLVTRYYQDQGYFLAKAFLPPQDVTEGIIIIEIQEGRLDSSDAGLQLLGEVNRTNPDFIRSLFTDAMSQGDVVSQSKLERAILLVNNTPGLKASVNLEPGVETGTTRVAMTLTEEPVAAYSASFDNTGSRYTGAERVTGNAVFSGLSGYADQLVLSANASNKDNTYLYAAYDSAIGTQGLRGGVSFSRLDYKLGEEFKSLNAEGYAEELIFRVSYPLVLRQFEQINLTASYDFKDLEDESAGSITKQRDIDVVRVGANWQKTDSWQGGGITSINGQFSVGELDLTGVITAFNQDQATLKTNGHYQKATYGFSRLQRVVDDVNLLARVSGQIAGDNLDSSEELQVGGAYGVRAYPSGEANGDEGNLLTLELQKVFKRNTMLGDIQGSVFFDKAWVTQNHNNRLVAQTQNDFQVQGWGLGLTASNPGKSQINLTWAHKIGKNPLRDSQTGNDSDGTNDDQRFWITASINF